MSLVGISPQEVEKLQDLTNEVYLYCEENNIKKRDVLIIREETQVRIQIESHVDQVHKDAIEAIADSYDEEKELEV